VNTQQGSRQVQVKLLLFTYNNENKWTIKPINLFYNKYLSVRILFRFWLSQIQEEQGPFISNYEDQQRAKIAYEGTKKHKTTEYFYFGKVRKDHTRDPKP